MAKYLIRANYTAEGTRGLLKNGGTNRKQAIEQLLKDAGGSLEAFYYAFGEDDVVSVVDVPDNVTAAAIGLTISSSGATHMTTTVLLTPEEIDLAAGKKVNYRPPGA